MASLTALPVASAQIGPPGGHSFPALGGAAAQTGSGGGAVSLELPPSRKGLPRPLSIVHTGSPRVGAAGIGWDIPISSVRKSTNIMRRKPAIIGATSAPARLIMNLAGSSMMMIPTEVADMYQPLSSPNSFDLVETKQGFIACDPSGTEYVFTEGDTFVPGMHDPGLYLLTEIRDPTRTDRVVIKYASGPLDSSCTWVTSDLRVTRLDYSPHDSREDAYLFRVEVLYAIRGSSPCGDLLNESFVHGALYNRHTIATGVKVYARNNLEDNGAQIVLREYELGYETTNDRPRLARVDVYGEGGKAGLAPRLPVARYDYGSAVKNGSISFQSNSWSVPRPTLGGGDGSLSRTVTTNAIIYLPGNVPAFVVKTTKARQLMVDMTGDGIVDLVYKKGSKWHMVPGYANRTSMSMNTAEVVIGEGIELDVVTERSAAKAAYSSGFPAEDVATTTEVWVKLIDWNGDGRPDIVDVRGGRDVNRWKVLINAPGPGGPDTIKWAEIQVLIGYARTYMKETAKFSWGPSIADNDERMPLSRSKVSVNIGRYHCKNSTDDQDFGCHLTAENQAQVERAAIGTSHFESITEWKLTNLNGDGFPDLAVNSRPLRRADYAWVIENTHVSNCLSHDGASWRNVLADPPTDSAGVSTVSCIDRDQLSLDSPELTGAPSVIGFHNQAGAVLTVATFGETPTSIKTYTYTKCGVERWAYGPNELDPLGNQDFQLLPLQRVGDTWMDCGFVDLTSDGLPEYVRASGGQAYIRFESSRATECASGGSGAFVERQTGGILDVTGDGLADYVFAGTDKSWYARPGDGRGFGPKITLDGSFELSKATGSCGSSASSTEAALDLDGDGRPEHIKIVNDVLRASSIVGAGGVVGAPSAGRLVAEHNGFGASRVIEYKNAKRELPGRNDLPHPEIVVASTRLNVTDGPSVDPTYYAYGDATLRYDPFMHRWRSSGYARRVVLSGQAAKKGEDDIVIGVLQIEDANMPTSYAGINSYALAGETIATYRLEGSFEPDPWAYVGIDAPTSSALRGGSTATELDVTLLAAADGSAPYVDECYDVEPYYGGPYTTYTMCHERAVPHAKRTTRWHGQSISNKVEVATTLSAFDTVGRAVLILDEGDTARTDDDLCVELSYATPIAGSRVRGALASRRLVEPVAESGSHKLGCAGGSKAKVYSHIEYRYDTLAVGQVDEGLLTKRLDHVYAPGTGALLETYSGTEVVYQPGGYRLPARVERRDSVTSALKTARDVEYDPWGYSAIRATNSAVDASTLVTRTSKSVLPSIGSSSTAPNGEVSIVRFGRFGRPVQTAIVAGGTEFTLGQIDYHDNTSGRWTQTWDSLDGQIVRPNTTITRFDALGNEIYRTRSLGSDYDGRSVITGVVEYDGVGRVVFAADPIECASPLAESCLAGLHYGTSADFLPGGRVAATTRGLGRLTNQAVTNPDDNVYPTTFDYTYAGGTFVTKARGPIANTPGHVAQSASDVTVESATGGVLEVRREQAGTVLERTKYGYDPLGNTASVIRFGDPATQSQPVQWSSAYDSLGRRHVLDEAGAATKYFEYDEHNGLHETRWIDGTSTRRDSSEFDGHGRRVRRTLSRQNGSVVTVESRSRYIYDVHSGSQHQPTSALLGRLSHTQQDGIMETFYGYDALGRRNYASRVSLSDTLGRVFAIGKEFDLLGRLRALRYEVPSASQPGKANYAYDSADRVSSVTWGAGGATTTLFTATEIDALGRYRSAVLGNGVRERFDFYPDGRQLLRSHVIETATTTHTRAHKLYDGAARVVQKSDTAQPKKKWTLAFPTVTTYAYDSLDRLTTADSLADSAFTYDPLGIARSVSQPGQEPTTSVPSTVDRDRLHTTKLGTTSYQLEYDGAGSVTRMAPSGLVRWGIPIYEYRYDSAGRAIGAEKTTRAFSNTAATLHWDANGALADIQIMAGSTETFRERRYGDLIRERWVPDVSELQIERIIPGPIGNVLVRTSESSEKILYGHVGANGTLMITDGSGAEVQLIDYAPFGAVASDTGDSGSFDYTLQQFNFGSVLKGLGVTLLGPRFYHSATARFLQRDPVMFDGAASMANPYAFSFNDPVNYVDRDGQSPKNASIFNRYHEYNRRISAAQRRYKTRGLGTPGSRDKYIADWFNISESFTAEETSAFILIDEARRLSPARRAIERELRNMNQKSIYNDGTIATPRNAKILQLLSALRRGPGVTSQGAPTALATYIVSRVILRRGHQAALRDAKWGGLAGDAALTFFGARYQVRAPGKIDFGRVLHTGGTVYQPRIAGGKRVNNRIDVEGMRHGKAQIVKTREGRYVITMDWHRSSPKRGAGKSWIEEVDGKLIIRTNWHNTLEHQ